MLMERRKFSVILYVMNLNWIYLHICMLDIYSSYIYILQYVVSFLKAVNCIDGTGGPNSGSYELLSGGKFLHIC